MKGKRKILFKNHGQLGWKVRRVEPQQETLSIDLQLGLPGQGGQQETLGIDLQLGPPGQNAELGHCFETFLGSSQLQYLRKPRPIVQRPRQQAAEEDLQQESQLQEHDTESGICFLSPLRSEESLDLNGNRIQPGLSPSTETMLSILNRIGSQLDLNDIATRLDLNEIASRWNYQDYEKQQALSLLKEQNVKHEEDLVLLQNKLAGEKESSVRVQREFTTEKEKFLREMAIKEKSCKLSAEMIECLQVLKQGLDNKLREAEVKIQEIQAQKQGLDTKLCDAEAKIQEMLCGICMERPRNAVCLPCLHLSFCVLCLEQHLRNRKTCPSCRMSTRSVLECFAT